MERSPRVSALIVSYNTRELLLEAIGSLQAEPQVEVIVVDNASRDGSAQAVASHYPGVRLVQSKTNLGFAGGTNLAASMADGETLLVLNPDARLTPGTLDELTQFLGHHPRAALVGPALQYPDGRHQAAAFAFPGLTQAFLDLFPVGRLMESRLNGRARVDDRRPVRVDHPLGACMLIRRTAWWDVGPLDEGYFMYLEEIDWCRRARQRGWEIWHDPKVVAVHHGGSSTRQHADAMYAQLWRSRLRYYQRFHGPIFNRALHLVVRVGLARAASQADPERSALIAAIGQLAA